MRWGLAWGRAVGARCGWTPENLPQTGSAERGDMETEPQATGRGSEKLPLADGGESCTEQARKRQ